MNAYKREPDYYAAADSAFLESIDPLFVLNARVFDTKSRDCAAGSTMISVKANGRARRCYFLFEPIGNIYDTALRPRPCSANACRCHIGYSHLPDLGLGNLFGIGLLERRAPGARAADTERVSAVRPGVECTPPA